MQNRNTGTILLFQLMLLTLLFQEGNHSKVINSFIGPYILYVERFYNIEPNNRPLPWTWNLRASHFNPYKPKELQRVTGNVTAVNVTLDDDCWAKVVMDLRSNNQWKENAFIFNFKKKACQVCREQSPGFSNQVLKGEDGGKCIRPPGVYEVNNAPLSWTFPNVPVVPYGYWRFRITFGKAENLYGYWVADAKTIPKTD